jgi:hypothetical protein
VGWYLTSAGSLLYNCLDERVSDIQSRPIRCTWPRLNITIKWIGIQWWSQDQRSTDVVRPRVVLILSARSKFCGMDLIRRRGIRLLIPAVNPHLTATGPSSSFQSRAFITKWTVPAHLQPHDPRPGRPRHAYTLHLSPLQVTRRLPTGRQRRAEDRPQETVSQSAWINPPRLHCTRAKRHGDTAPTTGEQFSSHRYLIACPNRRSGFQKRERILWRVPQRWRKPRRW